MIGGEVVTKPVEETDEDGNTVIEDKELVEGGLLAWGQECDPALDEMRKAIRLFHGDRAPSVVDPFAGGGAIPFEAMRLGCDVQASDLNPVSWLILKCTLDYPQQFSAKKMPLPSFVREWPDFVEDFLADKIKKRRGNKKRHFSDPAQLALMALPDSSLAWHVRAWGRWVLERVRADLAPRYPVSDGEPAVAFLWARTARDKNGSGRIPLLKTFWLNKRAGKRAALLPIPNADRSKVQFHLIQEPDFIRPEQIIEKFPVLKDWEIDAGHLVSFLNGGTMNRAGVWSPLSGRPGMISLTMDDLRRQGQQGLFGAQMTSVVAEATRPDSKRTFKRYRLPNEEDLQAAQVEIEDLDVAFSDIPFGIPEEPLPPVGTLGFRIPLYGFKKWRELFTNRQLLALSSFIGHTRSATSLIAKEDQKLAEAVGAYLAICIDRLADYSSAVCSWHHGRQIVRNTFGRFALPMVWDFCEVNPLSDSTGNFLGALEWVSLFIDHALETCSHSERPSVRIESALKNSTAPVDLVLTDPPYYNAIPYSDLMDFFYVWLRRTLFGLSPEVDKAFRAELSPKWNHEENDGELIDDESRFGGDKKKSKKNYEDGMAAAFQTKCASLTESGRMVIVFANKEVAAWETLISAVIRGGAVVTASWPIQTEMPNRTRGMSSAALSSSVWIVCRKRPAQAPAGWEENVIEHMKQILFDPREVLGGRNVLQYYFDLGIQGPDFIWAALGPALEAYSAHPYVKKTAGGMMTVEEFLGQVRRLVLQFSLGELPGFREAQKETQGRGESLEIDSVTQYYLLHRAYFSLDPAPAGACILYANACGKNETELRLRIAGTFLRRTQADVGIQPPRYETLPLVVSAAERARFAETPNERKILTAAAAGKTYDLEMELGSLWRQTGVVKARAVVEAIREQMRLGLEKIVLAYWHRDVGDILEEGLRSFGLVRLDGSTSPTNRESCEKRFRAPSNRIFLGQIQSAGEAIDLSPADEMWLVEYAMSPRLMEQVSKRIVNVEKKRNCFVRVVTIDQSIDDKIGERLMDLWKAINEVTK